MGKQEGSIADGFKNL